MRLIAKCSKTGLAMKAWGLLGLMTFASALPAEAGLCTFAWVSNSEPDLAGYRVYHSYSSNGYTAGEFTYKTQATFATCEDIGVGMDGQLHYLTVTAYDTAGNESPFPEEVWIQMPLLTEPAPEPAHAPTAPPPPPSPSCWWVFSRTCP